MDGTELLLESGLRLASESGARYLFAFAESVASARDLARRLGPSLSRTVLVLPKKAIPELAGDRLGAVAVVSCWSGNQSRFSRIKYAFLQSVLDGVISAQDRIVCLLGPAGKDRLDTLTIHDLARSWSEEFPFDVSPLIDSGCLETIMAALDIALDVGALGREGKPVGAIFVVGDSEAVLEQSHQAVFNPFKGYREEQRRIESPDVVESLKELSRLDGAIVISASGIVEAAGRHLDPEGRFHLRSRGLGARHRAGAGISASTRAVAIVVSESTGRVTIFKDGRHVATLEPLISRRIV